MPARLPLGTLPQRLEGVRSVARLGAAGPVRPVIFGSEALLEDEGGFRNTLQLAAVVDVGPLTGIFSKPSVSVGFIQAQRCRVILRNGDDSPLKGSHPERILGRF